MYGVIMEYGVRSSNSGLRSIRATASLLGFLGSTQPTQPERPKTGLSLQPGQACRSLEQYYVLLRAYYARSK